MSSDEHFHNSPWPTLPIAKGRLAVYAGRIQNWLDKPSGRRTQRCIGGALWLVARWDANAFFLPIIINGVMSAGHATEIIPISFYLIAGFLLIAKGENRTYVRTM